MVVIFVFFSRKSIGSNFRACLHAHKYSQKLDMLACIHTKWASLFSRAVFFAGGNFRIFSRRENYNSAKINVLKVYDLHKLYIENSYVLAISHLFCDLAPFLYTFFNFFFRSALLLSDTQLF